MSELTKTAEELKWIEEEPQKATVRPPIGEFEIVGNRSLSNTILKKSSENILVPIGLLATTACLTLGLVNFRRGDSKKQNLFMKGRVAFQGFTLVAMVTTMYMASTKKNKS